MWRTSAFVALRAFIKRNEAHLGNNPDNDDGSRQACLVMLRVCVQNYDKQKWLQNQDRTRFICAKINKCKPTLTCRSFFRSHTKCCMTIVTAHFISNNLHFTQLINLLIVIPLLLIRRKKKTTKRKSKSSPRSSRGSIWIKHKASTSPETSPTSWNER